MKKTALAMIVVSLLTSLILVSQLQFSTAEKVRVALAALATQGLGLICAYAFGVEFAENKQGAIKIIKTIEDPETKKVIINEYDAEDTRIHSTEYEFNQRFISRFKKVISSRDSG